MFLLGASATKFRTALAAAALVAAVPALGQAASNAASGAATEDSTAAIPPSKAPGAVWSIPPASREASKDDGLTSASQDSPEPAASAPAEGQLVGAEPARAAEAVAKEPSGPAKPAMNQAIRAALSRETAEALRQPPQLRAVRQAVDAFYASRGDAPVWLADGHWTPAARAAFERLQQAPDDGLDLRAFRVYSLDQGPDSSLALGDVALSEAVAAYALQASGGRIDPARISRLIGSHPPVVSAAQALDETSKSADADKTLHGYNPQHPGYLALRDKLAEVRSAPELQARIAATERGRRVSDAAPALGARRNADLEADIVTNMEFWRWLPRDLGADRVVVNIPEFTARLYRDNAVILPIRVITGKPDKPTPLFSDKMEYLVVNPSWNVPQSIIKNEMMPKLDALRAQGYDIRTVNGRLTVRQPPGERNALGQIKFIFPNDYAVYMHDTPTRNLFATSRRAYSHGCVRVDQPFKLAVDLLRPERGWTEERLKKMVGKTERRVNLPEPMPIHIVYFTFTVDQTGQAQRFEDIYGYGRKTRELLGLGG
ncbi:L,D-transpeptidase family protein [Rhodoblastus sp. 17X3]|uniref:L,D-transpeptidase family protein n=1 Tax=Rhodoblastus sp. 17X3 TaxID=3047026 RepID=UPI0024B7290F|nr:L,D-transpeptidase family protein [Rhodoblastus sp. 17X3]MDI9846507.1 L,D-transpeptidase family protein [Rhodoblastus sp. 17X3]